MSSDAPGRRWAHALAQWHKEGGQGRALRGTPEYNEVAAIYQEWHPTWYPTTPKYHKRTKRERVANHIAWLEKLGVKVQTEEKKAPVQAIQVEPARPARALRARPPTPEPDGSAEEPSPETVLSPAASVPEEALAALRQLSPAQVAAALKQLSLGD